jgi:nitrate reductase NapE component
LFLSVSPQPITAEAYLDRALPRIRRFMLGLAVAGTLICLAFFRWQVAAGFVVGAVISYLNQRWLERAIEALAERITTGHSQERGGAIVVRAALRYILIAAGAYVIFSVSLVGLYGFLGGVCLPIAAVACEVVAEALILLRRGTP